MTSDDLYIAATGVSLPPPVSVYSAVADGRYDSTEAARTEQVAVTIADAQQRSVDLATAAGRQALHRAQVSSTDIGAVLHAVVLHSGWDLWSSAAYIQNDLDIPDAWPVTEIRAACNGAMTGLELARSHLRTDQRHHAALITAGDCWHSIDRWRMESGIVYGDGAGALVVSRKRGFARLISLCSATASILEGVHRGDDPPHARNDGVQQIDLDARRRAFLRTMPREEMHRRIQSGVRVAVQQALSQASCKLGDVQHVVLQFLGASALRRAYIEPLGLDITRTTAKYGLGIGHLGASDPIVGLNHLVESGSLAPGDLTLILSAGAGYQWTAALIETIDHPPAEPQAHQVRDP